LRWFYFSFQERDDVGITRVEVYENHCDLEEFLRFYEISAGLLRME
jgi:hypothetical protein